MSEFACVVVAGIPALSLTVASALEALLRSFAVPLKIHQPQTAEKAEGMPRAAEVAHFWVTGITQGFVSCCSWH